LTYDLFFSLQLDSKSVNESVVHRNYVSDSFSHLLNIVIKLSQRPSNHDECQEEGPPSAKKDGDKGQRQGRQSCKGKGKAKKVIAPVDTESQPIYFSSTTGTYGFLSQWLPSQFSHDGVTHQWAEQ
jgi:hypothetical protein